jgi:hypothetical protein
MSENIKKIRECIGLLNSMVNCGEEHSDRSLALLAETRTALDAVESELARVNKFSSILGEVLSIDKKNREEKKGIYSD